MRLTSIRASNFLSFASGADGLKLSGMDGLTIIVGPNGAGKTNLLRVVKAILDALPRAGISHADDITERVNRLSASTAPLRLELGIEFDSKRERETIHSYWLNAMAYPESNSLNLTVEENGKTRGVQVQPQRLRHFAAWMEDHITTENVRPLFKGTLILQVDLPSRYPSATLSFECRLGRNLMVVGLEGRQVQSGSILFPGAGPAIHGRPALTAMIEALEPDVRQQVARFLDGQEIPLPNLPPFGLAQLASAATARPGWLSTNIPDQNGYTAYADDKLPSARARLNALMERDEADSERMHLGLMLGHLVRTALVWCLDWNVVCEEDVESDAGGSSAMLLSDHRLALYLLRLKNGSAEDRLVFATIQKDFHDLTGSILDVRIEVTAGQANQTPVAPVRRFGHLMRTHGLSSPQEQPTRHTAVITTDHEVPLTEGGSGRAQVALLVALTHHHASRILLLDEPELHLNPTLARELASQLMDRPEQTLMVTHSPYMIPPGSLASVRRIVALPSAASLVSPRVSARQVSKLNLRKRPAYPEDSMFLFSWCTVFVEGPDEVAALPVWFDKWCEIRGDDPHAGERFGVRFQSVGGANGVLPWLRTATLFSVPCLALYDADVLSVKPSKRKDSKQVPDQWRDAGLLSSEEALQWGDASWLRILHNRDRRIFFCGSTTEDDFETLPVCCSNKEAAVAATGGGPLAYRWIAETNPPPTEFKSLFEAALTCAKEAVGRK